MDKTLNIFHYIIHRYPPRQLGATKLYSILWFSDRETYLKTLKPITNETYVKSKQGPVLKRRKAILRQLVEQGKIKERPLTSQSPPDTTALTPKEIATINKVGDDIVQNHTAKSITKLSHDEVWELTPLGEEIPLYATLMSELGEVDEEDIAWAKGQLEAKDISSYVSPD